MNDETQKRLELLKVARQQLSTQYIKDRADAYTQWNLDSDRAWKESGIKLPFPPPPPMPTEADIVAYALALYNAQNPQPTPQPESPPVHTVVEPAPTPKEPPREEPINTHIPDTTPSEPTAPSTPATGGVSNTTSNSTPISTPVAATPTAPTTANAIPVAPDPVVDVMPEVLPPPVPVVPKPTVIAGAADRATGETAIKEIFNKPSADPAMVANEKPAPSVVPLLKSMLKKGLLPTWVKADNISGIKE